MYDAQGNYSQTPRAPREVRFLGELPITGKWIMHAVPTSATKDAIVLVDTSGQHEPRIVKDGALTILKPMYPFALPTVIGAPHLTGEGANSGGASGVVAGVFGDTCKEPSAYKPGGLRGGKGAINPSKSE